MADTPSPWGIRANSDVLSALGKLGAGVSNAQTQGRLTGNQYRQQAVGQQQDLSNTLFNQSQTDATNRANILGNMTNFTELLSAQNRRDQMLRQLAAKNPRIGNWANSFATPDERQRNIGEDVWKEGAAAAEFLSPGQWNERYDTGIMQNLLTGDKNASLRDSIMRTGQDGLARQAAEKTNWQDNQTSSAQQMQQLLDSSARAADSTSLLSKLSLLMSVLGGIGKVGATKAATGGAV